MTTFLHFWLCLFLICPMGVVAMIEAIKTPVDYSEKIRPEINNCLTATDLNCGEKYEGKVRCWRSKNDENLKILKMI